MALLEGKWQRNLLRHLILVILSFVLVIPFIYFMNKSYYFTIGNVNYWEEIEISSLLTYILDRNPGVEEIRSELAPQLDHIRFLAMSIQKGDDVIYQKDIKGYEIDPESRKVYPVKDFVLTTHRRLYFNFFYDCRRYLRSLNPFNKIYWTTPVRELYKKNASLLHHVNLTIFMMQGVILLFSELMLLYVSVKYRFFTIRTEVDRLRAKISGEE